MKLVIDTRLNKEDDCKYILPFDIYEEYGLQYNYHEPVANDIVIKWGDKKTLTIKQGEKLNYENLIHIYSKPGKYTITVEGSIPCFCCHPTYDEENNSLKLIEVLEFEVPLNKKLDYMFYGCENLTNIEFINEVDFVSAVCCLYNCKNLKTINETFSSQLHKADITGCFYGCGIDGYDDLKQFSIPKTHILPTGENFVDIPNGIDDLIINVQHS